MQATTATANAPIFILSPVHGLWNDEQSIPLDRSFAPLRFRKLQLFSLEDFGGSQLSRHCAKRNQVRTVRSNPGNCPVDANPLQEDLNETKSGEVAGETAVRSIYVRRYLHDGSPDPSFDGNGRVETNLGSDSGA